MLKVNEGLSSIKIQFCKLGPKGLCEVCSAIGKKSTLESLTRPFGMLNVGVAVYACNSIHLEVFILVDMGCSPLVFSDSVK